MPRHSDLIYLSFIERYSKKGEEVRDTIQAMEGLTPAQRV